MKIPFSIYDFFGYLLAGFLVLAAIDFTYNAAGVLAGASSALVITFWAVAAYIAGHLIAGASSAVLERGLTIRGLGPSENALLSPQRHDRRARFFSNYFRPLPQETQARVLARATKVAAITEPGRGLFFHCWANAKKDPPTLDRLNSFLNLYGFSRNISFAAALASLIVAARLVYLAVTKQTIAPGFYWGLIAGVVVAIGMYFRYLKFYRLYGVEVFTTYAELD
jgi:hypothetical protein